MRVEQLGEFVECRSCRSTFPVYVLDAQPGSPVEDIVTTALRHAVSTVLGHNNLTPRDKREAVIVLQRYASVPYGSSDLEIDLREGADQPAGQDLRQLALSLNDRGRVAVLDATVQLVGRNPNPHEHDIAAIKAVADALSLPGDRVRRTLDQRIDQLAMAS